MLILIMMVVAVVAPLVALIVTEVLEQRYAERRARKWGTAL